MAERSRYRCFISHHTETQSGLANLMARMAGRIGTRWYHLAPARVFVARDYLRPGEGLPVGIESALRDSMALVLLASPESAAAPWVSREIKLWRDSKPGKAIIIAIGSGKWRWSASDGDFDWADTDAISPSLKGAFVHEPIMVDFRSLVTTHSLTDLPQEPEFQSKMNGLVAGILGKDPIAFSKELLAETRKRHLAVAVAAAAAGVLIATAAWSLHRRSLAEESRIATKRSACFFGLTQRNDFRNVADRISHCRTGNMSECDAARAKLEQMGRTSEALGAVETHGQFLQRELERCMKQ